jgi:hypothetical protein
MVDPLIVLLNYCATLWLDSDAAKGDREFHRDLIISIVEFGAVAKSNCGLVRRKTSPQITADVIRSGPSITRAGI